MSRVTRALNLREAEGRPLGVMAAFLFLNTANTTVISAAKNGLFLSEYGGDLIPYVVIAAALLTAVVAIVFAGVISGMGRRTLAVGVTVALGASLIGSRMAFQVDPSSAFLLYI